MQFSWELTSAHIGFFEFGGNKFSRLDFKLYSWEEVFFGFHVRYFKVTKKYTNITVIIVNKIR